MLGWLGESWSRELVGGVGWGPSFAAPTTLTVLKMPRKTPHKYILSDDQNRNELFFKTDRNTMHSTMGVQYGKYMPRPVDRLRPLLYVGPGLFGGEGS